MKYPDEIQSSPEAARNFDRWQRLKRNPDYIAACQGEEFDENGLSMEEGRKPPPFQFLEGQSREEAFRKHVEKLRDQIKALKFGLYCLVDPDCDPCAPFILEGSIFNDSRPVSLLSWSERENECGEYISPIIDDKFIVVKIDVSRKKKEISHDFNALLDESREEYAKLTARQGGDLTDITGRVHYEKRFEYYRIWDLRQEGKTYRDIALRTKIEGEDINTVIERIKKRYIAAFDLIQGTPGDEERKIWANNIEGFCKNCKDTKCLDDYETGKQWRPCPRLLAAGGNAYLNQDEKKGTDALLSPDIDRFGR